MLKINENGFISENIMCFTLTVKRCIIPYIWQNIYAYKTSLGSGSLPSARLTKYMKSDYV